MKHSDIQAIEAGMHTFKAAVDELQAIRDALVSYQKDFATASETLGGSPKRWAELQERVIAMREELESYLGNLHKEEAKVATGLERLYSLRSSEAKNALAEYVATDVRLLVQHITMAVYDYKEFPKTIEFGATLIPQLPDDD